MSTRRYADLRKRARTLEHDIDQKLVALNRLNQSVSNGRPALGVSADLGGRRAADRQPLLDSEDGASSADPSARFERLRAELQTALASLGDINEQVRRDGMQPIGAVA